MAATVTRRHFLEGAAGALAVISAEAVAAPAVRKVLPRPVMRAHPARPGEFRGVWLHTVMQTNRFASRSPAQLRAYLTQAVDTLRKTGFNAVIFQIRPEGDAFYRSGLEPWSRYLTGTQGRAPAGDFDPLAFMIALCRQRGMEFHAWINPYRMSMSANAQLAPNHLYRRHPEWFVTYDGKLYLNPGLPMCRNWIRSVVRDIVMRYDIDALHMDDYFYPYPVKGKVFDDSRAFLLHAAGFGIRRGDRDALGKFRRASVNALILALRRDLKSIRPKIRFGISPFGIYRNRKTWAGGSDTDGLQCYDDLYADVLKWARNGWIDYLVPQLYWEIGHRQADYVRLCSWWAANVPTGCRLYIGQSIERSLDGPAASAPDLIRSSRNFIAKLNQARADRRIAGECFWHGYRILENDWRVRDFLRQSVF